jgi:hypothetical protein
MVKNMGGTIQLLQPQELEVYYILPALRRELAKALKGQGRSQKYIAELFGVSEAAVSQYLHEKRGAEVDFPAALHKPIKKAASRITDKAAFIKEMQQLLHKVWHDKVICSVCHDQNGTAIPRGCAVCFE